MLRADHIPFELTSEYAEAAARVHRRSFDNRLPWLSGLHTADEDAAYFRSHVFRDCMVWGIEDSEELVGMIAFRPGWIDQLYVLPEHQGRGYGDALLQVAQSRFDELQLWTFQKNSEARNFYEKRGFVAVEYTDGLENEEREPDMRYTWSRKT